MKRYEELEHTADWAFRAYGRDLKELFENAAAALMALQGVEVDGAAQAAVSREVDVTGIDYESLLVNWLSELLYLQETRHETYSSLNVVELTPTRLRAQVRGTPSGPLNKFVKAVTYHDLRIEQTAEGWQATVVVDV